MEIAALYMPQDFNRRPRTLHYLHQYKCTEFRRLLLYGGVMVFKDILQNAYRNFLELHTAMYILSSPKYVQDEKLIAVAKLILNAFVANSSTVFDDSFVVYNVHSVKHLADECRDNGPVDEFSAYKFENLGTVRKVLRSREKPLQQLANRDFECKGWLLSSERDLHDDVLLDRPRAIKEREDYEGDQWLKITLSGYKLSVESSYCCFNTIDGEVVKLSNIIHCPDGQITLAGYKFSRLQNYYTYPINSSEIGIFKVDQLQKVKKYWNIFKFSQKCVLLPSSDEEYFSLWLSFFTDDGQPSSLEVVPTKWFCDEGKVSLFYPPNALHAKRLAMALEDPDPKTWSKIENIKFHYSY
ncbi:hypothetical protein FOCC_FOCC012381, partial [Frankliniella occidentalis]